MTNNADVSKTTYAVSKFFVIYCGLLMSIGAFSIDITLPSFTAIVDDFKAPYGLVQWTITVYFLTSSIGQLLWGPASDQYGRKPTLLIGLALYLVGCLIAAFAPSITILLAARALQGFGAAAAMVASRSIIRDLYSGDELARNMALATMLFAIGPIVAPLVGSLIATFTSWRMIFLVLVAWSSLLFLLGTRFRETIGERSTDALNPAAYLRRIKRMIGHPQSRHFLMMSLIAMSAMLLILTGVPRIYEVHFNITGFTFACFFAAHGVGIIAGQWANRRLISRFGTLSASIYGNYVLIVASGLMVITWVAGISGPFVLSGLIILFATSYLIVYSNAAALVLDPHGDIAGFAAAFYGFTSQAGASLLVSLLVFFIGDSGVLWTATLFGTCIVSCAFLLVWQRRQMRCVTNT